ncbi:MAG: type II toxin-antitoxin system ParD family antitoxin [Nitrosospira sp.]
MITRHIKLSAEMENYIKDKVATGAYHNSTEVIRDAIRRMQAEDRRLSTCQATLAKGDAQPDEDDGISTLNLIERTMQSTRFHQAFQLSD